MGRCCRTKKNKTGRLPDHPGALRPRGVLRGGGRIKGVVCVKRAHAHAHPSEMRVEVGCWGLNGLETKALMETGCMIDGGGMMRWC